MKLSLRAKLTGVILALAVVITGAVTVGSYTQMRNQLINTGIRNEVSATAIGASALITEPRMKMMMAAKTVDRRP